MTKLNGWKKVFVAFLLFAASAIATPAQVTFTNLGSFNVTSNGYEPSGPLVQDAHGTIYGTVTYGGGVSGGVNGPCELQSGCGGIFTLKPADGIALDYPFCNNNPSCTSGIFPAYGMLLADNGELYGTTASGGTEQVGTVYTFSQHAGVTTIYNFCALQQGFDCVNGFEPTGGLMQGADGNFYGTTIYGGAASTPSGTLFKLTPAGNLTTLYSFCAAGACPGGAHPTAPPVQTANGSFYGTANFGGANNSADCMSAGCGAIYQATPTGEVTTLYNFCSETNCTDGSTPTAALVQDNDGNIYGTTLWGGAGGTQNICYGACGTFFKITTAGKLITLYNFCSQANCADGSSPYSTLTLGSDGNFYGTTTNGGSSTSFCSTLNGCGTIFKITPGGTLTTLHSFDMTDGYYPTALFQATDGDFYGTTEAGGDSQKCIFGCGTAFKLSVGLPPFVRALPNVGKAETNVIILGSNVSGATAVSFNGTAATFTVVSTTEIKATVPAGATSGFITVTTPSGVIRSNVKFRVAE
jgi:uncharacterized repeat protein (TIGR03803 family)